MNKKRIISWSAALITLLLAAIYNLSMLTLKTQEAKADCIRYLIMGCTNASTCCSSGMTTISHVWVGVGVYNRYASMCASF